MSRFSVAITIYLFLDNLLFAQSGTFKVDTIPLFDKPTLYCDLGDSIVTPDAMAIDGQGRLFLSVPNFANRALGSKICVITDDHQVQTWFDTLPKHPLSDAVFPMGIEFGRDGALYIADAQSPVNGKAIGRLLRVIIRNGKPLRTEVLVEGFSSANGLRIFGNSVFISDSYIPIKGKRSQSGIYSFDFDEFKKGKIMLRENVEDSHLVCLFSCREENGKECMGGADGLAFDSKGNLYAGNFNDGVISRIVLDKKGKALEQRVIINSDKFKCCDGMFYDKKSNSIFIANFANNSVHRLNLSDHKLELIWENGDAGDDSALLDQPCEPILYKEQLLVVNFDSFVGFKNKAVDSKHTISAFRLKR